METLIKEALGCKVKAPKYTDEYLKSVIARYIKLYDFRKEQKTLYMWIIKTGKNLLLKGLYSPRKKGCKKYSDAFISGTASRYTKLDIFKSDYPDLYDFVVKAGKGELIAHLSKNPRIGRCKYSDEHIQSVARLYTSITLFRREHSNMYAAILHHKKKHLIPHLVKVINSYPDDLAKETVAKYTDLNTFEKENPGLYRSLCRTGRFHFMIPLRRKKYGNGVYKYSDELLKTAIAKYTTQKEFRKKEPNLYGFILAHKKKHLIAGLKAAPSRRGNFKYSDEYAIKVISNYAYLKDFRIAQHNLYCAINRYNKKHLIAHLLSTPTHLPGCCPFTDDEIKSMVALYTDFPSFTREQGKMHRALIYWEKLDFLAPLIPAFSEARKFVGEFSGALFLKFKNSAVARGLAFSVTQEECWAQYEAQKGLCALTGQKLNFGDPEAPLRRGIKDRNASLDRIDSSKGYTKENIQWVTKGFNMFKRTYTVDQLVTMCRAVVNWADRDKPTSAASVPLIDHSESVS